MERRLAALEQSVAALSMGAEHLMDRGQIPPSDAKAAEWRATLMDVGQPASDRISALRMLRRNGLFDETAAHTTANWLLSSADPNEQRHLLEHLRGAGSAALKQVTLNLASTSDEARVRERAVANLRQYGDDPSVETALWQMLAAEDSTEVRRRIVDTLGRFPMTDARAASLRAGALDPYASIEKRAASLRILQSGNQDISDIAVPLAQAAEQATDTQERLGFIQAFDDVNHPEFMVPLVAAAQDEDPGVRLRAADALVDYRADPVIKEWLVHLAEHDPNPEVRQEASRVYRQGGRRGR
jgi:HEAT repeat protein